jgi:hypothetical protein
VIRLTKGAGFLDRDNQLFLINDAGPMDRREQVYTFITESSSEARKVKSVIVVVGFSPADKSRLHSKPVNERNCLRPLWP